MAFPHGIHFWIQFLFPVVTFCADRHGRNLQKLKILQSVADRESVEVGADGMVDVLDNEVGADGTDELVDGMVSAEVGADGTVKAQDGVDLDASNVDMGADAEPQADAAANMSQPSGFGNEFWIPPWHSHDDGFEGLMIWRRRNLKFLRSEILSLMSPSFSLQLLRREHRAADRLGNGDGCVDVYEHPEFPILAEAFGRKTDRICSSHVFHYSRSSAFRRDMQSVRRSHRELLRLVKVSKQEVMEKIDKELKHLSNPKDVPLFNYSRFSKVSVRWSQANSRDLVAELEAEKETLAHQSDAEFQLSEGMMGNTDNSLIDSAQGAEAAVDAFGNVEQSKSPVAKKHLMRRGNHDTRNFATDLDSSLALAPNTTTCVYNRQDVCDLKLRHVPLLGSHNAGSYPTMFLECFKRRQECVEWATKTRKECSKQVYECIDWAKKVEKKCTSWHSKCTNWSKKRCGIFKFICGMFCAVTSVVCVAFTWVTRAVCHGWGYVCKGFTYFVEYVGCNVYALFCLASHTLPIIECQWQNQNFGFLEQISKGVRFLDIDSCLVNNNVRNCHGAGFFRAIGSDLPHDIELLSTWLKNNPSEILMIGWSNRDFGKQGQDYPEDKTDKTAVWNYHTGLLDAALEKYFAPYVCTGHCPSKLSPCISDKVCFMKGTQALDIKLSEMIKNNVRLIVGDSTTDDDARNELTKDSWSEDVSKGSPGDVVKHLEDFCDATPAGENVMLSAFGHPFGKAAWSRTSKYELECPNHCDEEAGNNPATCECKAGKGEVQEIIWQGNTSRGNTSGGALAEDELGCLRWHADKINSKLVGSLDGIADRCFDRNVSISVVAVDYVEKHNSGLQTAIHRLIDRAVEKFR